MRIPVFQTLHRLLYANITENYTSELVFYLTPLIHTLLLLHILLTLIRYQNEGNHGHPTTTSPKLTPLA